MPTWLSLFVAALAAGACALLSVRSALWFRRVWRAPADDPTWDNPASRLYELGVSALLTVILAAAVFGIPGFVLQS